VEKVHDVEEAHVELARKQAARSRLFGLEYEAVEKRVAVGS